MIPAIDEDNEAHRIIRLIAQKSAHKGLRLRDARALFDVLFMSDALGHTKGDHTAAGKLVEVSRETVMRIRNRSVEALFRDLE